MRDDKAEAEDLGSNLGYVFRVAEKHDPLGHSLLPSPPLPPPYPIVTTKLLLTNSRKKKGVGRGRTE